MFKVNNFELTTVRFLGKPTHGQGALFLEQFIAVIKNAKTPPYDLAFFDCDSAYVKTEYYAGKVTDTQGGRIDIFIKDKNNRIILIENKVNAGPTGNQLERYRASFPSSFLVYLTLFEENTKEYDAFVNEYMTYHYDLLNWLDACRKECIDLPILREALAQYMKLIKKLTYQRNSDVMDKTIIDHILKDNDSLESFQKLLSYRDNVNQAVQEAFLVKVRALVHELGMEHTGLELENLKTKYQPFVIYTTDIKDKNIGVFGEFDRDNLVDFYMGLGYFTNLKTPFTYSEPTKDSIKQNGYKYSNNDLGWVCHKYFDPLINWNNDTVILSMHTEEALEALKAELTFLKDLAESLAPLPPVV
ncbi:PD-(D/E)XK nuclease family protein [Myroides sp. DF42-4-2]|nr:PD-(D/E)XK nuclease family protein [Myroides sp. DF42-4-2]